MTNKTRFFDNLNKLEGDTFYPKQPCVCQTNQLDMR